MVEEIHSNNVGNSSEKPAVYPGFGLAVACFVLGILSIPFSLFLIGGIYGLLGLILGIVHLSKKNYLLRPLTMWGLSLSLVGLLGSAGFGIYYFLQVKQLRQTMSMMETREYEEWIGVEAPDLTLKVLDGNTVILSELRGRSVILDFWATWCPPCRMEIPHFVKLRNRYDANDLAIIGISSEDVNTLNSFAREHRINYLLASEKDLPEPYADVTSIPTTFFIDQEGIIRHVAEGYHDFEDLNNFVNVLNSEPNASGQEQDQSGHVEP
jgi:peroxiredoxin